MSAGTGASGTATSAALHRLATRPVIVTAVATSRDAIAQLRWHPALRRRTAEVRAEVGLHAARSSAALDGARYPVAVFRDVARGTGQFPQDASGQVARGALRALNQADQLEAELTRSPMGALARLHTAAVAGLVAADAAGRPRGPDELPGDGIGAPDEAPTGSALAARLAGVVALLAAPQDVPALVISALVHAELLTARPFVVGNALVARAAARAVAISRGLDPLGVTLADAVHLADPVGYARAAAGYTTGSVDAVDAWLAHCGVAFTEGAAQGRLLADAVLAGRLPG